MTARDLTTFEAQPFGLTLARTLSESVPIVRVRLSTRPDGSVPQSFALDDAASELRYRELSGSRLPLGLTVHRPVESRWELTLPLADDVRCFGLGERYSGLNLRGRTHTLFATDDKNHLEAIDSMYKAVPCVVLFRAGVCTALFLDSPARTRWRLDPDLTGTLGIEVASRRGFTFYVIGPAELPQVVGAYTRLTGRAPLPPAWALGHHQSRYGYESAAEALAVARELRQRRLPSDALVLDIHYLDEGRPFTVSPTRFADFEALVQQLHELDLRVVTILNPAVSAAPNDPLGVSGRERDVFCRAGDRPYAAPARPGLAHWPDFLRPDVRAWWGERHAFLIDRGVDGIWNDMNEPALFGDEHPLPADARELPPDDAQLFLQTTPEGDVGHFEVRSLYGLTMCRATWEGLLQLRPNQRPFVLTRSGYAGMQRYGACWLGDNFSWFEHLRLSIPMLLNLGLCGVPFTGVDVGGFDDDATGELVARWYQLGIFYPYLRNHCSIGRRHQEPWQFGSLVEDAVRRLLEVRYQLLPYLQGLFHEHRQTGAPILRPLCWHYPDDPIALEIDDQLLFGEHVLVAPIVTRGTRRRAVYLPAGRWYPFGGGEPLLGGRYHSCEWGWSDVPAFVKQGTILPLAEPSPSTARLSSAELRLRVFGTTARGVLYEDDGASRDYEHGGYNRWQLRVNGRKLRATLEHAGYDAPPRRVVLEGPGYRREVQLKR